MVSSLRKNLIFSSLLGIGTGLPNLTGGNGGDKSTCDTWGQIDATPIPLVLYNDLWGRDQGQGSQCITMLESTHGKGGDGKSLGWQTTSDWQGSKEKVKSYANALFVPSQHVGVNDSAISIPIEWYYTYTATSVIANVALDMFTVARDGDANHPTVEVMVWSSALGDAAPLGNAVAELNPVVMEDASYTLYYGTHDGLKVYSFVRADAGARMTASWTTDAMQFLRFLVNLNQTQSRRESIDAVPNHHQLLRIGAGTEVFTATHATLTTTRYSIQLKKQAEEPQESSGSAKTGTVTVMESIKSKPHPSSSASQQQQQQQQQHGHKESRRGRNHHGATRSVY